MVIDGAVNALAEQPTTYATIDKYVRRQAQPRRLAVTDLRTDR